VAFSYDGQDEKIVCWHCTKRYKRSAMSANKPMSSGITERGKPEVASAADPKGRGDRCSI